MAATIADNLKLAHGLTSISASPRLDVEVLLSYAVSRDRTYLYTWPEKILTQSQQQTFSRALARRRAGEPVAYIVGEKEFWSLDLSVNSSTLIPRPDTETLIECVLDLAHRPQTVLDLGTGTGAIALALAKEYPASQIIGVDQSPDAVALARYNSQKNKLNNACFFRSDWFDIFVALRFDLIVSNPPYIDSADAHLTQGDVRFEPASALISENQGLADLEKIITRAPYYLKPQAYLFVEHGWQQASAVRTLYQKNRYRDIMTYPDLAGQDRVTIGRVGD